MLFLANKRDFFGFIVVEYKIGFLLFDWKLCLGITVVAGWRIRCFDDFLGEFS